MPADIPAFNPKRKTVGDTDDRADRITPKARGNSTTPKRMPAATKASLQDLREAMENALGLIAMAFAARGDLYCAEIITDGSPDLIDSWIWLAKKHDGVRRVLGYLVGSGGYTALALSTLGVALPIMQHHGLYPENMPTPKSMPDMMSNLFGNNESDAEDDNETEESD